MPKYESLSKWIRRGANIFNRNLGGRVGIGTRSPDTILEVRTKEPKNVSGQDVLKIKAPIGWSHIGSGPVLRFSSQTEGIEIGAIRGAALGSAKPGLAFETGWTIPAIRMVIARHGNIGIGVIDPHSLLEVAGAISSAAATMTASSDNYNVAGINILFVKITTNIVLGGLRGGVNGQVLHIVYKGNYTARLTVEDTEGVGDQDIYTHTRLDETVDGGGYTLVCDGSNWYDCSHARHV